MKGKRVIVPMTGREVPFIFDAYVDPEFGTGSLKITPAHDINDYEIGLKHNIETIDIFNDDGTISERAGLFIGCLLYTSDAADDLLCVDLGGRRIIKKKTKRNSDRTEQQTEP